MKARLGLAAVLLCAPALMSATAQQGAAAANGSHCDSITDATAHAACIKQAQAGGSLPGADANPPSDSNGAQSNGKPGALPGADADPPGSADAPAPQRQTQTPSNQTPLPGADANPPSESMKPLPGYHTPSSAGAPPASGDGTSSSSSSSSSQMPDSGDDDAPPTTSAGDTPVKSTRLKDLGSHADVTGARAKLEAERVPDDLKVGHFYLEQGNPQGAYLRFKDAAEHDPENPEARFGLAEAANRLKKRDEAIANYQLCLALDPGGDHDKAARAALKGMGAAPAK